MITQKAFMDRISRALGREGVPDIIKPSYDYTKGLQFSNLQGLDAKGLRDVFHAQDKVRDYTYMECDQKELGRVLAQIIAKENPNRIVVPKDTTADGLDVLALLQDAKQEVYAYDKDAEKTAQRATIESAGLSITIPFRAIAETGTVLELSQDTCGKAVSLLPPAHISIIFQSRLRATLTEVAPELDAMGESGKLPSSVLFVSGPSSTGDIESILVTGVHGPTREYNIVVRDM